MAGKKREPIQEKDIQGLKYFDMLLPMLERLHEVGCQRDKAGNRKLHFDQYCLLLLLSFFNPITRSMRGIQQASTLRNVQRKLGCARTSRGSLSEATAVFDPEKLKEIVMELGARAKPVARDPRLQDVKHWETRAPPMPCTARWHRIPIGACARPRPWRWAAYQTTPKCRR